jgi:hypothetical protein
MVYFRRSFLTNHNSYNIETKRSVNNIVGRQKIACSLHHSVFLGGRNYRFCLCEGFIRPGLNFDENNIPLGSDHNKVDFTGLTGEVAREDFQAFSLEEFQAAFFTPPAKQLSVGQKFISVQQQISYNAPDIRLFGNGMFAVPLGEPDRLACTFTEVVQLCPSCLAASQRPYIDNIRRMKRENSLDTFVVNNTADGEVFINSPPLTCDYGACKYLRTFFIALLNATVDVNDIAYLEMRYLFL